MDDLRFDRLTKTLGVGGTRRAATRLIAGGAIGALLVRTGLVPAPAAERDGHCRGGGKSCKNNDQCCTDHCQQGVCTCKKQGKCDTDKVCCSGKCHRGECSEQATGVTGGCPDKDYLCFRSLVDVGKCTPVSLQTVRVPTCFAGFSGCQPGYGQCPRKPCEDCNARFPACEGQCRAAAGCTRPGKGGSVPQVVC